MTFALRGAFWFALYVLVAVAPLAVASFGAPAGKGWLIDFSVALGFVGLAIMTLQFALSARFKRVAAPFGMDSMLQYHRGVGFVALAFVLAHPVLLFVADRKYVALLDITTSPLRAKLAVSATLALVLLMATSVWRKGLRLRYETWQLVHEIFAVAIVGGGLAHAALVGRYMGATWQRVLWIGMSAGLVALLGWVRIVKPLSLLKRPWRVERVKAERGRAWTLSLAPDGHAGVRFEAGQFGWLTLGATPFALTQHPFSISSSAEDAAMIELTIKARGDFTNGIANVKPGARAYLEGPHGVFTPDRHEGAAFVLIGGGIGITPLMSMVRTFADRDDARPISLVYGANDWESVTFREEIDELKKKLQLDVLFVLEKGHDGWSGETGRIDAALLDRHLPKRRDRAQYFVCGPSPMMDAMESALSSLGIPADRVHTERFDMV